MQLSDLNIDSTRQYMVDIHGKRYPIKKQRGRFYIQHATGQLTVTSIVKEHKEYDIFRDYVLSGARETNPCVVMEYWLMKYRMMVRIKPKQFKETKLFAATLNKLKARVNTQAILNDCLPL